MYITKQTIGFISYQITLKGCDYFCHWKIEKKIWCHYCVIFLSPSWGFFLERKLLHERGKGSIWHRTGAKLVWWFRITHWHEFDLNTVKIRAVKPWNGFSQTLQKIACKMIYLEGRKLLGTLFFLAFSIYLLSAHRISSWIPLDRWLSM